MVHNESCVMTTQKIQTKMCSHICIHVLNNHLKRTQDIKQRSRVIIHALSIYMSKQTCKKLLRNSFL